MALTRDFKQTVVERVQRNPAFAKALLDEAATLFLNGEPETARLLLRELVNATVSFEDLAIMTAPPQELAPHAVTERQPEHGQPIRHFRCRAPQAQGWY